MRMLFAIICSVLLSAQNASAEVCMMADEGRIVPDGRSPVSPSSPTCSAVMAFGNALSDFYGSDVFIPVSNLYWAPHRLTISEIGQPMIRQHILAKILSPEGVAKITQEPEKFLARMPEFETELRPYLCGYGDVPAFINAGGVAEFNLRVAANKPFAYLFDGVIATVYLTKENCEEI